MAHGGGTVLSRFAGWAYCCEFRAFEPFKCVDDTISYDSRGFIVSIGCDRCGHHGIVCTTRSGHWLVDWDSYLCQLPALNSSRCENKKRGTYIFGFSHSLFHFYLNIARSPLVSFQEETVEDKRSNNCEIKAGRESCTYLYSDDEPTPKFI